MRVAFMVAVLLSLATTHARAQTALETFRFITLGDAYSECPKEKTAEIASCVIRNTDGEIYMETSGTIYGKETRQIIKYTRKSDCEFTQNIKQITSGETTDISKIFDYSKLSGFEYDENITKMTNEAEERVGHLHGFFYVTGDLTGGHQKYVVNGGGNGEPREGAAKVMVRIMASSSEIAKSRFEAALRYFKEKYCHGSAF